MNQFTIGQKLEGDGLAFEVTQVEPVARIKCLKVSSFWQSIHLVKMPNNPTVMQQTWKVGKEYDLRETTPCSVNGRNYVAVSHLVPWHVFFTNGTITYYR